MALLVRGNDVGRFIIAAVEEDVFTVAREYSVRLGEDLISTWDKLDQRRYIAVSPCPKFQI